MRDETFTFIAGWLFGVLVGAGFVASVKDQEALNQKWRNKIVDSPAEIDAIRSEVLAIRAREALENGVEKK